MTALKQRLRRLRAIAVALLVSTVAALAWPAAMPRVAEAPVGGKPFAWGRDSLWTALETSFAASRVDGCSHEVAVRASADSIDRMLGGLRQERITPASPALDSLETAFFGLAPRAAPCKALANDYVKLQGRLREAIKFQSTDRKSTRLNSSHG